MTLTSFAVDKGPPLQQPVDYQVIQRSSRDRGSVTILGQLREWLARVDAVIEVRFVGDQQKDILWRRVDGTINGRELKG